MWKYYITTDNVFWDNATINKPDSSYINNLNWIETNINVDMQNINKISFYSTIDGIRLLKVVNTTTNKVLYYYFERILKYVKNNYLLEFTLDYWCTYTLNLIKQNVNVLAERHQDYSDFKCLEFDDPVLNGLELSYLNFTNSKFLLESEEVNNKIRFYASDTPRSIDINKNDVLNGVYSLVIGDSNSPNQAYELIPVLSKLNPVAINVQDENIETKTLFNDQGEYKQILFKNRPDLLNWLIQQKDLNKTLSVKVIVKSSRSGKQNTSILNYYSLNNVFNLTNTGFYYSWRKNNNSWEFVLQIQEKLEPTGIKLIESQTVDTPFSIAYGQPNLDELTFEFLASEYGLVAQTTTAYNSVVGINSLINSQGNKIIGMFITPNVFNLSKLWSITNYENKPYLSLKIRTQGEIIKKNKIAQGFITADSLSFDSKIPLHKIIYKFVDCNWYNNNIDLSKCIDGNGDLWIGDYVNFTNTFSLKNQNAIIPLDNQLITFPAQQPLTLDTYTNYVKANMNTINTGLQVTKENASFSNMQNTLNSILGMLNGNMSSGINGLMGSIANALKVSRYEKLITAKYLDANTIMGNKLLFSSNQDILWSDLINGDNNFELLIIKSLSTDSIKLLNNTLLLYGVYNPKYLNLSTYESPTRSLGFYYLKLNTKDILTQFSSLINESLETKEIIYSQLQEFRVWSKIPEIKNTSN